MTAKKPTTAPLAHRVPAEPTALILDYCRWLKEQTGYDVDPMSVYLGSALRGEFQKSPGNLMVGGWLGASTVTTTWAWAVPPLPSETV